jgi:hypothetical protein
MRGDANRKPPFGATESKTLRMRGSSLHGNRETLETPTSNRGEGRFGKAHGRTPNMYVARELDGSIVPKKRANKADPMAAAESVEGRGPTKENAARTLLAPDTAPEWRGIGASGVRAIVMYPR